MSTLDKITAEIEEARYGLINDGLDVALKIIEKYAEQEQKILDTIDFAIDASNGDTNYFVGFRNGLRYAKSLVDGEEPQYESCAEQEQADEWQNGYDRAWEEAEVFYEKEPCEDVVSRQAVVNAIKYAQVNFTINSTINFANYTKEVQAIVDNILSAQIKAINELPSVRPQEQTGHWEEIVKEHKCYARDDTYTTTEYHCSECGAEPFENEDGFYELSNYCPNCGANMRKESHE